MTKRFLKSIVLMVCLLGLFSSPLCSSHPTVSGVVLGGALGVQSGPSISALSTGGQPLGVVVSLGSTSLEVPDSFAFDANVADLAVSPVLTLDEESSIDIGITILYDDSTSSVLNDSEATLFSPDDFISVTSTTVSAGLLYQDESGQLDVSARGLNRSFPLNVLNVDPDNFPPFQDDGLPDDWEVQFYGVSGTGFSGAFGDDDGDGLNNLLEFGLGGMPVVADVPGELAPEIFIASFGADEFLHVRYERRVTAANPSGIVYRLEASDDLNPAQWTLLANEIEVQPPADGFETVVVRDSVPLSSQTRRFVRLLLSIP